MTIPVEWIGLAVLVAIIAYVLFRMSRTVMEMEKAAKSLNRFAAMAGTFAGGVTKLLEGQRRIAEKIADLEQAVQPERPERHQLQDDLMSERDLQLQELMETEHLSKEAAGRKLDDEKQLYDRLSQLVRSA